MPIFYRIDVLAKLKEQGFTTYKIRKEKLLAESTVQALRRGDLVSLDNISRICHLLKCQPGDILGYREGAERTGGGATTGGVTLQALRDALQQR